MKRWSEEEEKLVIKLLEDGYKYNEIAGLLDRTYRSIKEKLNKLGYQSIKGKCDVEYICNNCGKTFVGKIGNNRKFCSSSCSATYNNKLRVDINKRKRSEYHNRKNNKCLNCGNITTNKYCDSKCQHELKYKEYIKEWKNGLNEGVRGEGQISRYIVKYLFDKHNNKCSKCGWSEINTHTGRVPLEVEHIDGDSSNNSPDNLTLLCPNCHSLTETYKGANRGNGRYYRRERYKNGKSY